MDGLKLLYGRESTDAKGLIAINRSLFGPHRPSSVELINDEMARHLEMVDTVSGDERAWVFYNLGCFALFGDEVLEAHYYFSEAAKEKPDSAAALHNLAYTHELRAETDQAREIYHQALAQNSAYTISRVNLAQLDLSEGKFDEALTLLRDLRRAQPANHGLTLYLCRALLQRSGESDAQEVLTLLASSSKWQSYQDLKECHAYAKYLCEDYDGAEADFRDLMIDDASSQFAIIGMIKICTKRKDWVSLQSFAEQYHSINPSQQSENLLAALAEE